MSADFLRINAIFREDHHVTDVINWINTGKRRQPAWATKRFMTNYDKGFIVRDGKLVYEPLNVTVIPKGKIKELLTSIYNRPSSGLGKSIGSMFKFVQLQYANITRDEVAAFMRSQAQYQVGQPPKARVNKPFVANSPNSLWCTDLIDLNPYIMANVQRYRYILTVIDVFSRRVFLGKLKKKTAKDVADEFVRILNRAGVAPGRILADNGTEFEGLFAQTCAEQNIRISHSRTHQPQSNSLIERANKEVRKLAKAAFIASKNLNWVTYLPAIEHNINTSYHSAIKCAPMTLWKPTRGAPEEDDDPIVQRAIETAQAASQKKIDRYKETEFAVGDRVRVTMSSMFSQVRAAIKSGNRKQIVVEYTPEIYVVHRKIVPRDGGITRPRYVLQTQEGESLHVSDRVEAQWFAADMIMANDAVLHFDVQTALRLNQAHRTPNDIEVV